ncbi:MAG TPA: helix-turn-helix domain-containing protein [bacterium]|nr:helix-turn-helix domain-containing protein [bacterium]
MIAGFNDLSCYEILDISPGAEAKEIQEGYYRVREIFAKNALASYSLYTAPEREEILRVIEDAYRTLIDEKSRGEYDRHLHLERVKSIKAGKARQEALPLMPREAAGQMEPGADEEAPPADAEQGTDRESLQAEQPTPDENEKQDVTEKQETGAEHKVAETPPPQPRTGRITSAEDKEEDIEEAVALGREERDKMLEGPATAGPVKAEVSAPPVAPPSRPDAAAPEAMQPKPAPEAPASALTGKGAGATAAPGPPSGEKSGMKAPGPLMAGKGEEAAAPARDKTPPPMPAKDKTPAPAPARDKTPALAAAKPAGPPVHPGRFGERERKPLPGAAPITPAGVKRADLKPPLSARGREPFEDTVYDVPSPPAKARPMDNVESGGSGRFFKERREAKGITLNQVWETTKIRKPILEAIEKEDYAKLPAAVFLKGMLKSYARMLAIEEPEAAIKGYVDRMTTAKQWME